MFELMFFSGMLIFFIVLVLALTIFWIWAIIDCIKSNLSTEEKLLWIVILLFFSVFGAIIYVVVAKSMKKRVTKGTGFKGRKLVRPRNGRILAGVCLGLGTYWNMDPTIVRLLWILITLFGGFFPGIFSYIIAAIIIPEA